MPIFMFAKVSSSKHSDKLSSTPVVAICGSQQYVMQELITHVISNHYIPPVNEILAIVIRHNSPHIKYAQDTRQSPPKF